MKIFAYCGRIESSGQEHTAVSLCVFLCKIVLSVTREQLRVGTTAVHCTHNEGNMNFVTKIEFNMEREHDSEDGKKKVKECVSKNSLSFPVKQTQQSSAVVRNPHHCVAKEK